MLGVGGIVATQHAPGAAARTAHRASMVFTQHTEKPDRMPQRARRSCRQILNDRPTPAAPQRHDGCPRLLSGILLGTSSLPWATRKEEFESAMAEPLEAWMC